MKTVVTTRLDGKYSSRNERIEDSFQKYTKKGRRWRTAIESGIVKKDEFIKIELLWEELPVHLG